MAVLVATHLAVFLAGLLLGAFLGGVLLLRFIRLAALTAEQGRAEAAAASVPGGSPGVPS